MTHRISPNFYHPNEDSPKYDNASFNPEKSSFGLSSRYRKLEESVPFSKKVKSHKKHFAQNLHQFTHLKYLGGTNNSPRLESNHDKLDTRDISGATPDYFRNEIFRNRIYGKQVDRQHIFARNHPLPVLTREETSSNNAYRPKFDTEASSYPKTTQLYEEIAHPHSVKLNIQHEVMALQVPPEREPRPNVSERRRIKTELDNPESYFRDYPRGQSREVRRWNPTYLTDTSNPLLSFLPRIK